MKVPVYTVVFDVPVYTRQLYRFRGAVNEIIRSLKERFEERKLETDVYHNHIENKEYLTTLVRYPLIQYQEIKGKAAITGIGKGAVALDLLVDFRPSTICFDNKSFPLKVDNIIGGEHEFRLLKQPQEYFIYEWLALNQENYSLWRASDDLVERVRILNRILTGNIHRLLFESGATEMVEKAEVNLTDLSKQQTVQVFSHELIPFNANFKTNIELPERIGLGQHVSLGFGKLKKI